MQDFYWQTTFGQLPEGQKVLLNSGHSNCTSWWNWYLFLYSTAIHYKEIKHFIYMKWDLQISLFHTVQQHVDQIFIVSRQVGRKKNKTKKIINQTLLKELHKSRLQVPHHKVSEHSAANTTPIGRTGKRRRKESKCRGERLPLQEKKLITTILGHSLFVYLRLAQQFRLINVHLVLNSTNQWWGRFNLPQSLGILFFLPLNP